MGIFACNLGIWRYMCMNDGYMWVYVDVWWVSLDV